MTCCGHGFEEYTGRYVAASAPGGVGLLNPVKAGLANRPEDWRWSSVHDYTGNITDAPVTPSGLSVDRVMLPADPRTRI